MALYIEIEKVLEKENIGYYHIFTQQFGGADFYAGIDKKSQKIYYYLTNDFSISVRIVDCNDPNERVGELSGVSASILAKIFIIAKKTFKLSFFPGY